MPESPGAQTYLLRARKDAVRGSLWTFTATVVGVPAALIANVVVARSLGVHGLGRFATYTTIFALVMIATNLGWSEATVQWLAAASARGSEDERHELIRRCAGFHLVVAGPAAAACAFALLLSSGLVIASVGAIVVMLTELLGTSTVINTATARNALAAQIALVVNLASQAGLAAAAAASRRPGFTWAVLLLLTLLGPALGAARLHRDERRALFRPRLVLRAASGFWTYAVSACAGALVAALVFGRSELLLLRANGLLAAAGIFTVITALAAQMTTPLDSLLAPVTPIAAGLMAVDRARAIRLLELSLRIAAVINTVGTCVLLPIGVVAIRPAYGAAFAAAAAPFALLGIVSCTQTVLGPLNAFAFATRSAAQVLRINVVCLALDALLAVALIPVIGLWGAVIASAAAQLLSLVWTTILVASRLSLRLLSLLRTLPLFGVGAALGAIEAVVCLELPHPQALLAAPVVVLVGLLVLRACLLRFGQLRLRHDDVELLASASPTRTMRALLRALAVAGVTRPNPS